MATPITITIVSTDYENVTLTVPFDADPNTDEFVLHRSVLADTPSAYTPVHTFPNVEGPAGFVTAVVPISALETENVTTPIYLRATRVNYGNESPILASPTTILILPTDILTEDLDPTKATANVIFGRRALDGAFVPLLAEDNGDGTFSLTTSTTIPGTVTVEPAGGSMPVNDNSGSLTIDTAGGNIGTNTHDGAGTAITSTVVGLDTGLDVNVIGGINVEVDLDHTEDSISVYGWDGVSNYQLRTDTSGHLQIDVLSSALPLGAATEATLASADSTLTLMNAKFVDGTDIGDVTVNNAAGGSAVNIQDGGNSITVDAVNLDIRDLAAGTDSIDSHLHDGGGTALTSTLVSGKQSLDVNVTSGINVEVDLNHTDDSVSVYGTDGAINRHLKTDADGHLQIDVLSSALPTGAATESTLSTLNAKFVSGTDIGDVTVNNGAGGGAVNIQDGGNSITVDDGGTNLGVDLHDGSSTALTSTLVSGKQSLDVNVANALTVDIDLDESTDSVQVYGFDGVANQPIATNNAGELEVQVVNANTSPVFIANDSTGTLTVDDGGTTLSIDDGGSSITVDGTVNVGNTVTIQDGGNVITVDGAVNMYDGAGTPLTSTLVSGKQSLDVNVTSGINVEVDLDHADDSVSIYGNDGNDGAGTDRKVKTNANGQLDIVATDLDIRALTSGTDTVTVVQTTASNLNAHVSATDLDIRDLTNGTDNVAVYGNDGLTNRVLRTNATGNLDIVATDLDIRDLSHTSDSVTSRLNDGSGNSISSTAGALDVNVASGDLSVDLDNSEDNVQIYGNDGNDGAGTNRAIKTNANGSVDVVATDLDIRDLAAATDAVSSWLKDGSGNSIGSTTGSLDVNVTNTTIDVSDGGGSLTVDDGGGSLTVDGSVDLDNAAALDYDTGAGTVNQTIIGIALPGSGGPVAGGTAANPVVVSSTDLDIRDLSSASDSVAVLQATHDSLNANVNLQVGDVDVANGNPVPVSDAGGSLTVDATDLDIRDLTAASDSVEAWAHDGTGTAITSTGGALDVNVASGVTLTVDLDNANDDVLVYGWDGVANQKIKTDVNGELQVDVLSSALPTGAATSANQTTANGHLSTIAGDTTSLDSKINTLGQKAMAASTPVVIASDQSSIDVDIVSALPAGTNNIGDVDIASSPTGASSITVQGAGADGAAVVGNPVLVGGFDGVNAQTLLTDASGHLQIDVLSQPALSSGTDSVTVLQSTAANLNATVVATDLDIRDLTSASDSVEVLQATAADLNATVVGPAADGAAASGNPVQVAGKDGSGNIQTIATDTDGAVEITGTSQSYAAPTFGTSTTSSTQLVAANTSRKYLVLVNDSDEDIYLGVGAAAVVGSGVRLNKNGGSFEVNLLNLTTQAINSIHGGTGSKNVTIHEAT
jgi:hypothetical protein